MNEYEREQLSLTEQREHRDKEQLGRLTKLLTDKLLVAELLGNVRSMSYSNRCSFEKMTEQENARLKGWHDALSIDAADIRELSEILNAKTPDKQALVAACTKCGLEPKDMGVLLGLFSDGKMVGISELMSERGKTKSKNISRRNVNMGLRWLQLEHEDPRRYGVKAKVIVKLAEEFELEVSTTTKLINGTRELNTKLFPDGVDAARRAAGLPPRL